MRRECERGLEKWGPQERTEWPSGIRILYFGQKSQIWNISHSLFVVVLSENIETPFISAHNFFFSLLSPRFLFAAASPLFIEDWSPENSKYPEYQVLSENHKHDERRELICRAHNIFCENGAEAGRGRKVEFSKSEVLVEGERERQLAERGK